MGWNVDLSSAALAEVGVGQEWIELGGDVLDPGVDLGRSLADNVLDLLPRGGSRNRVALDLDVDVRIVIEVIEAGRGSVRVVLWDLDAGTRLLLQGLDGGTSAADDVGAGRLGDGDEDCLLLQEGIN